MGLYSYAQNALRQAPYLCSGRCALGVLRTPALGAELHGTHLALELGYAMVRGPCPGLS